MWSYNYDNGELAHHGVLGMKWGVRRYQNRDGSLTSAGKKHRSSDSSESDPNQKKVSEKKESPPAKRKASDMTDEELRNAINRKRLEKDYNTLYPAKVSAGKKFADTMKDKVIIPAATEAAKQLAKEFLLSKGKTMLDLPSGGDNKKDKK